MTKVKGSLRQFVINEGQTVARERRLGFYRWMLGIIRMGYDPRDDLMGDYHGRNE
mgnify:CR=1 FL=1